MDGTTFTAENIIVGENGFGSKSWIITDKDGNELTVSYQANFVGLEGNEAVDAAIKMTLQQIKWFMIKVYLALVAVILMIEH